MEKLTSKVAEKFNAAFESAEVKSLIEATEKAVEKDTGTFEVVVTSENVDRYNEVVQQAGLDTTHYMQNPVVLWGHDHNNIIGVCTELTKRSDGKTVAKGKFAPTDEGQEKRKLYEEGFLKATSIGFIEKEREGNLITKSELIEFSFVSVPANPYALSLALQHERSIDELVQKGIFTVKEAMAEAEETETIIEEKKVEHVLVFSADQEKAMAESIANIVLEKLLDSALEGDDDVAPEGTEGDDVDEEVRIFETKLALQKAATVLGEELAERRRARK